MKNYFNTNFLDFFDELSKNNTTEWFNDNRKLYEYEVKKPFAVFVEAMIRNIQEYEPEIMISPSEAILRINKDIRFSKDKTPYSTHVAANISVYGKKNRAFPGFYFQLSHEGLHIYGGAYVVESTMLPGIRHYIAGNLKGFSAAYNDQLFKEKYGTIQGEQNKRIPPEFLSVQEKEPLIANKQFFYTASLKPDIITSTELTTQLMAYYLAGKKVNDFFKLALISR